MLVKTSSKPFKMAERSLSPEATIKPANPLPVDNVSTSSAFVYPSGIPGLGKSILGPRMPRVLKTVTTSSTMPPRSMESNEGINTENTISSLNERPSTAHNQQEYHQSAMPSIKKRKLSASETEQAPAKSERLPPGSKGIAASITNTEQRLYPDDHHVGHQQSPNLAYIVQSTKNLITPYTHLHSSCASTKPLQIIRASLSTQSFTTTTLIVLLTDARELLKALAERQIGVVEKLEPAMARFQQAGMESMLQDARAKAQKTDTDVQKLGQWLAQCDEMA
jgi:hypothetical protein